jgi:hypothetical protein
MAEVIFFILIVIAAIYFHQMKEESFWRNVEQKQKKAEIKKEKDEILGVFNHGMRKYENEKYYDAIQLFEKIKLKDNLNVLSNKADIMITQCHFMLGNYNKVLASNHYSNEEEECYQKTISAFRLGQKSIAMQNANRGYKYNPTKFLGLVLENSMDNRIIIDWKIGFIPIYIFDRMLSAASVISNKKNLTLNEIEKVLRIEELDISNGNVSFHGIDSFFKKVVDIKLPIIFNELTSLKYLNLSRMRGRIDISVLKLFDNLEEVNLFETEVDNIDTIKRLNKIRYVNISRNNFGMPKFVIDVSHIVSESLEHLVLDNVLLVNEEYLGRCINLKSLSIINTKVDSWNFVISLRSLSTLYVQGIPNDLICVLPKSNLSHIYVASASTSPKTYNISGQMITIVENKYRGKNDWELKLRSLVEFEKWKILQQEKLSHNHRMVASSNEKPFPKCLLPYQFDINDDSFKRVARKVPVIPRTNKVVQKGPLEDVFYNRLRKSFPNLVFNTYALEIGLLTYYYPDIVYADFENGIFIDIEVDEPYSLKENIPTHFIGSDDDRNETFLRANWFVVRFAEEQIYYNLDACVIFVSEFVYSIYKALEIGAEFSLPVANFQVSQWTETQAIQLAKRKSRGAYLNIQK